MGLSIWEMSDHMLSLSSPFRPAMIDDAPALADLVDFAGEGLPSYLWAKMAQPGETAMDVGRRRAAREEGAFSYRNAVVADLGAGAVAMLVGYPIGDTPEPIGADMPAMFVPMQELENLACGTWYVNVLAAYPKHRNRGLGGQMLGLAEQWMHETGRSGLSVIVSDGNHGARRLYERHGYRFRAQRLMVKEEWGNPGTNWVLLAK